MSIHVYYTCMHTYMGKKINRKNDLEPKTKYDRDRHAAFCIVFGGLSQTKSNLDVNLCILVG